MSALTILEPEEKKVNRSELRSDQRSILAYVIGQRVVIVQSKHEDDEKVILDRRYFEELLAQLKSMFETLLIATDSKLFANLMMAAKTIDGDIRLGKLHSFEEAFK